MNKILKEPFFHFLLLGGVLYLYYLSTPSAKQQSNAKKVITISSEEIQLLRHNYKEKNHRTISEKELQLFIQKYYYDKILLNEAYSLGLDKKDDLIVQRLLHQMQFIMTNSVKVVEPTEEQLKKYYHDNIVDYSILKTLSFETIFEQNKSKKELDTIYQLLLLNKVNPKDAASYGDRCRLSNSVKDISFDEAKMIYGNFFATKLFSFKSGVWHKAISSKFGKHFVYITAKKVGEALPFDEVEDRVYEDYIAQQRRDQKELSFRKLATQYKLKIQ